MSPPFFVLKAINRLQPGLMLDVGARDCSVARPFAEMGYEVDAVDPLPPPMQSTHKRITYHQARFEDFKAEAAYDLVVASLVSQHVRYDTQTFLTRLKSLVRQDGLIYVTLFGTDDGWADIPVVKALTFEQALTAFAALGLTPLYRSIEWLDAKTYAGDVKSWHLFRFVLSA